MTRKTNGFILWAWSQRPRVLMAIWIAIIAWKRYVFVSLPYLLENWKLHWFVCDDCGEKFNGNAEGCYGCRDYQCGKCTDSAKIRRQHTDKSIAAQIEHGGDSHPYGN